MLVNIEADKEMEQIKTILTLLVYWSDQDYFKFYSFAVIMEFILGTKL